MGKKTENYERYFKLFESLINGSTDKLSDSQLEDVLDEMEALWASFTPEELEEANKELKVYVEGMEEGDCANCTNCHCDKKDLN
jgi:hypothetical protein